MGLLALTGALGLVFWDNIRPQTNGELSLQLGRQHPVRGSPVRFVRGRNMSYSGIGFPAIYSYLQGTSVVIPANANVDELASFFAQGHPYREAVARTIEHHLEQGRRQIPLQLLLSPFVQEHLDHGIDRAVVKHHWAGAPYPNCFNAALSFASSRTRPRYVSPAEFKRKLRADYWLLQPGETMQYGDLLVIWGVAAGSRDVRSSDGKRLTPWLQAPSHVSVFLARDLVFSKGSNTPEVPYHLESYGGSLAYYYDRGRTGRLMTVHRLNE